MGRHRMQRDAFWMPTFSFAESRQDLSVYAMVIANGGKILSGDTWRRSVSYSLVEPRKIILLATMQGYTRNFGFRDGDGDRRKDSKRS